jgi:hypothetical protein
MDSGYENQRIRELKWDIAAQLGANNISQALNNAIWLLSKETTNYPFYQG